MKLEYSNLAEWGKASRKIKQRRGSYYWGTPSKDDLAGWQLQMFTADKESKAESKRNLAALKQKAQEVEAPVLVLRSNDVQLIGTQLSLTTNDLVDDEWMDSLGEYFDNRNYYFSKPFWTHHENDHNNHAFCLWSYGGDALWARSPDTGFYLVNEDRKVTDRKEQIQILWDLGFVARRGRPAGIGWERHSGSTAEIALITQMAKNMGPRCGSSEVADKICSTYRSINRYYAWPGNW